MKQLYRYIPRKTLEELYKLYVRPHIEYGDVIYHIPDHESVHYCSKNYTIHPWWRVLSQYSTRQLLSCLVRGRDHLGISYMKI